MISQTSEYALRAIVFLAARDKSTPASAKEISQAAFDEGVRANVARARRRLEELLTAEQMAAYRQLKPREQVLREESH